MGNLGLGGAARSEFTADMPRFLAALSTVLLLSACSSGPEPAEPPAPPDPGPVPSVQNGHEIEHSRWVGIGSYDACGLSWAIDLVQEHANFL